MDSLDVISSPESADGIWLYSSPNGRRIGKSGRDLARASHSVPLENVEDLQIPVISGRNGSVSSRSVLLQSCLESRLRTLNLGSIWCSLIWRTSVTPAGRRIFQLFARAHNTNGKGSGLLPTPTRRDGRTLAGSQPPKRKPTSGLPLAWYIALRLKIFKGRLNPDRIGLLMGYPQRVLQCRPLEMQSSRRLGPNLSRRSLAQSEILRS